MLSDLLLLFSLHHAGQHTKKIFKLKKGFGPTAYRRFYSEGLKFFFAPKNFLITSLWNKIQRYLSRFWPLRDANKEQQQGGEGNDGSTGETVRNLIPIL